MEDAECVITDSRPSESPVQMPGECRDDLYIKETSIPDPNRPNRLSYRFDGLFTRKPIKQYGFIGFYTGAWMHETAGDSLTPLQSAYAVHLQEGMLIVPSLSGCDGASKRVSYKAHPISMANEPPRHARANAYLHQFVLGAEDVEGAPSSSPGHGNKRGRSTKRKDADDELFYCVALVACKDIQANEEIWWHYGPHYEPVRKSRNYEAGKACFLGRGDDANVQHPTDVLQRKVSRTCVSVVIQTPDNTDEDDTDEDDTDEEERAWEEEKQKKKGSMSRAARKAAALRVRDGGDVP
tara:strand:- start:110 stop:994 length:885 start_codon:yes stop_codon:yes gene_type:complete